MKPILYMAPIMGVTNRIYRNIFSDLFEGYDYAVTPFIRSSKVASVINKQFRDIDVSKINSSFGLIPQILSNNSEDFIRLAKDMFDLGYEVVNWNLGCPHKKIRKKIRGAGLLSFPDRIIKFLEDVVPAIPNKISLKCRLGNENGEELFYLLPLLNDFPLKEIIIHPRIGSQMYTGEVDEISFEKCLSLTKHEIVYNGEIDSVDKFNYFVERFPTINKWMIGRGGVTNPFLAEQIKNLTSDTLEKKIDRFREFHNELFEYYKKELSGQSHVLHKMKEVWFYWSKAFEEGHSLFIAISRTKDFSKYLFLVEKFFSSKVNL
jgi:tRNA-dihydrouridine synthase B